MALQLPSLNPHVGRINGSTLQKTGTVRKTVPTVPKEPVNHLPGPTVPGRVRSVRYGVRPILPMLNVR